MTHDPPAAVVRAWHEALNRGDLDGVLRLSAADIEIVGPRGSAAGREALRRWLDHTRVELRPGRLFARGDTVVAAQTGIWRSPETGEVVGEAEVASIFRVAQGRVAYYARKDDLPTALAGAGLEESDAT